ncbi:integrase catalytic domain-containing protein [Trichonephila clavipes]|nr:integrase catalytic domain-containing protein [Trichonephila clavipes]
MLARFRLYGFGVSADIRRAFLQIRLYEQNQNFLRFLWHSEGELIHYRHCRVVFGVSSSPFLLGSTIQYHLEKKLEEAKQGRGKCPECIVQKLSSFYADNCLASVQTQSELDRFIDVATEIMAERKFDLRGWEHSNPSDLIASPTNVLGMIWDRHCDTLSLNIPDLRELMEQVITKRNILAASHKVFDPLEGSLVHSVATTKTWTAKFVKISNWLGSSRYKNKSRLSEMAKEAGILKACSSTKVVTL